MSAGLWASSLVGLHGLRGNPLRTGLSTLGIVIGVAALVAVLAVGDGVERYARRQIERTTDLQAVVLTPRTTRIVDGLLVPDTQFTRFLASDPAAIRAAVAVFAAFTPGTLALAAGAAILVGLAFGIYPALRAARLSPIDAIRYE